MSANNNAGSKQKRPCLGDDAANFVYTNLEDHVPDGVIHVRVHPSIKVIPARAFSGRRGLMSVELNDGIGVIEKHAFFQCRSLREIILTPFIRAIEDGAFFGCSELTTVILNDGLEEIGERAFWRCALVCINIPPLRQGNQELCIL